MAPVTLGVVPAYNRNYHTKQDVLADWDNNRDFKIIQGPYINKQQQATLTRDGYQVIEFYFGPGLTTRFTLTL